VLSGVLGRRGAIIRPEVLARPDVLLGRGISELFGVLLRRGLRRFRAEGVPDAAEFFRIPHADSSTSIRRVIN
jgi:hypothetical protein